MVLQLYNKDIQIDLFIHCALWYCERDVNFLMGNYAHNNMKFQMIVAYKFQTISEK